MRAKIFKAAENVKIFWGYINQTSRLRLTVIVTSFLHWKRILKSKDFSSYLYIKYKKSYSSSSSQTGKILVSFLASTLD